MKETKYIQLFVFTLFIITFTTGCISNKNDQLILKKYGKNKLVYIKNDTVAYDSYQKTQTILQTLKRGEEYQVVEIQDVFLELIKPQDNNIKNSIWVYADDIEKHKTYFLNLLVNASSPIITINGQNYKANMRLSKGVYKVHISASNFLDTTFDLEIYKDTNQTVVLDFDMDEINKKMAEAKIKRELKESIYIQIEQNLMWQDNAAVSRVKKPWIEKENYEVNNLNELNGDTASSYCKNLTLANFKDWRLPTKEELKKSTYSKESLKYTSSNWYWSSTTSDANNQLAWSIYFDNSDGYTDFKNVSNFVRCVRDN